MVSSAVAEPLTVGALGATALVLIDPPDTGIPWCPSALVFGVVCPLCGLTRGVARLVRGDVAASVEFHPMAWAVLAVACGAWIAWFGRRVGWWSWRNPRLERMSVYGLTVGLVVTWIWRAVAGSLPSISG